MKTPSLIASESIVLSVMLRVATERQMLAELLKPEAFRSKAHRALFRFLSRMDGDLNQTAACAGLTTDRQLRAAGGRRAIAKLFSSEATPDHARTQVQLLKARFDHDILRGLAKDLNKAATSGDHRRIADALNRIEDFRLREAGRDVRIYKAKDLALRSFEQTEFIVPEILPVGLALLVGPPKLGKSALALAIAIAVAKGGTALGRWNVKQGSVLVLALEDSDQRVADRLGRMEALESPGWLHFAHEWRHLGQGGEAAIVSWLRGHSQARLVIVDTLARVLPANASRPGATKYEIDVATLAPLQRLAVKHGICILVVHHTRKARATDVIETVSGTNGLAGTADTTLVLQRSRGQTEGILTVMGRDVEEHDWALRSDRMRWSVVGKADEVDDSSTRSQILKFLDSAEEPATAREVSDGTGIDYGTVRRALNRMKADRMVLSPKRGLFASLSLCPNDPKVRLGSERPRDIATNGTAPGAEDESAPVGTAIKRERIVFQDDPNPGRPDARRGASRHDPASAPGEAMT